MATLPNVAVNGTPVLLAIDDVSFPWRQNTCLHLSKPSIRTEPVLSPSALESNAPDNLAAHFYGTVLHDQGHFRMWYYACHFGKNPDWPGPLMQQVAKTPAWIKGVSPIYQGPLCYAESDDGVDWTKPTLNQVCFKGSSENNALALPHTVVSSAAVIRDDDATDPQRRYKMVYQFFPDQAEPVISEYGTMPTIALATSPDGINWTCSGIPFRNQFVEHCSFVKHKHRYIVHYHLADPHWCGADGGPCGRIGVARQSYDFTHWPDLICETFALPEPTDGARGWRGQYDQVHLGVGATSFGNICVGLYGLWHNVDNKNAFDQISCDLGLVVSNDGLHFREPVKGYTFISRQESPVTPIPGKDYRTVLCQGNGIINVADDTLIYFGRWRNVGHQVEDQPNYRAEVALATLPRDRWGALTLMPQAENGCVCTAPLQLPGSGCSVSLNADGAEGISVDILDKQFVPLKPFCGSSGGKIKQDTLSSPVHWSEGEFNALAGQTVRLQVHMNRRKNIDPRLYAIYISSVDSA